MSQMTTQTVYEIVDAGCNVLGWSTSRELADKTADAIEADHDRETTVREAEKGTQHEGYLEIVASMPWQLEYRADVEGDWTKTEIPDGFASEADAQAWWDANYRGPDEFGNCARPRISKAN